MATENINFKIVPAGWRNAVDLYFLNKGQGVNAYVVRRRRMADIARLWAMDDAELGQLGLTRSDIIPFVFDDLFPD